MNKWLSRYSSRYIYLDKSEHSVYDVDVIPHPCDTSSRFVLEWLNINGLQTNHNII